MRKFKQKLYGIGEHTRVHYNN